MRFSVLIPVFNRDDLVGQAIDSVLAQSFVDHELIVVDDGSTDGTPDLLRTYGDRIRAVRQENQGPDMARRAGAALASGEYLAFLDSDDVFFPRALATYDRVIRAFRDPAIVLGSMIFSQPSRPLPAIGRDEDTVEAVPYPDFLAMGRGLSMSNSKIVLRRSAFESAQARRVRGPAVFPMEDHDLLLRAGTSGTCVNVLRPPTVAYRVHGSNYVHNLEAMVGGTLALVAAEKCGCYPGGKARRFSRRAYIGGKVYFWIKKSIRGGRRDLALELLKRGGPMVVAAMGRKLLRGARPEARPHVVPKETKDASP